MGFWNNVIRLNLQDFRPGIQSVAECGDRLVMACMEIGPGKEDAGHQHPFEQCGVVVAVQSWFHWFHRPNGEAGMYLRNFGTNQTVRLAPGVKAPSTAPRQVVFSVRPGSVEVSTSSGEKFTLTQEWLKSGTPVYLHVHSHPGPEGDPASFTGFTAVC